MLQALLLSSYLTIPQDGQLKKAFNIIGYLKANPKSKLGFKPAHPDTNKNRFHQNDWAEFYRDAEEAILGNIPVATGKFMSTHCFVSVNYYGDTETRGSQTIILLFCNSAPIIWFRNMQNSVEASMFGLEFTEMKNSVETIEALLYKLRMFGVQIDGTTNIFFDNGEVFVNTTQPKLTLSKNHHSIAYHRAREAVEAGSVRVSKEHTPANLDGLLTKTMAAPKRERLLYKFTY